MRVSRFVVAFCAIAVLSGKEKKEKKRAKKQQKIIEQQKQLQQQGSAFDTLMNKIISRYNLNVACLFIDIVHSVFCKVFIFNKTPECCKPKKGFSVADGIPFFLPFLVVAKTRQQLTGRKMTRRKIKRRRKGKKINLVSPESKRLLKRLPRKLSKKLQPLLIF